MLILKNATFLPKLKSLFYNNLNILNIIGTDKYDLMNANILLFTDSGDRVETYRPGGIYKVASILRKHGYSTMVNHLCLELTKKGWQEVAKKYKSKDLIWVGISTTFLTLSSNHYKIWKEHFYNSDSKLFAHDTFSRHHSVNGSVVLNRSRDHERLVFDKEILEFIYDLFEVPVVVGGSQLTRNSNISDCYSENKKIIFFPGYAEDELKNLTQSIESTQQYVDTRKNFYAIDREEYRKSSYIWTNDDHIETTEWLPLEINRGCAFSCAYCTYDHIGQKNNDHYRHPSILYNEITNNYEKFGTTKYNILDDLYNDSLIKVKTLHEEVFSKLNFKVEWTSYCRLDLFWRFPEQIEIVKNDGIKATSFGIETLNDKAGKLVGKGLGEKRILETLEKVKHIWKDDVYSYGMWIAGLPYELPQSWQSTADLQKNWGLTNGNSWQPLHINKNKNSMHRSELDKNYQIYGYTFDENKWLHKDGYTELDAKEFCIKAKGEEQHRIKGHHTYSVFRQFGLSHQDCINTTGQMRNTILKKALITRRTFNKNFIS